ncbi:MAG: hypothetical protein K2J39_07370 [Ruminococcus sp.]|nr:hypothetical protein [Ruminococcus sp.]
MAIIRYLDFFRLSYFSLFAWSITKTLTTLTLNISDNLDLMAIYLPSDYGQPENIITNNFPYLNIIYE